MHPRYECFPSFVPFYPYVSMGIGAQNGSATGKVNNVKSVGYDHWKVQTSTSVSFLSKKSQDSSMMVFLVIMQ